eukprot:COSAG02_NODE_594_length_19849_cov_323.373114_10_plen_102_part_00
MILVAVLFAPRIAALSEAQRIANSNGLTTGSSPIGNPVELRRSTGMEVVPSAVASSVTHSPGSSGRSKSAASTKTKDQLYAEATARVAQELAVHRQKWSKT